MMVLCHDKYPERHKNFIAALLKVPGKHICIHVNNAKEALDALEMYEFDFISMDDLEGGKEIAIEVMSWRQEDRPQVVNIHSYAPHAAREIAKIFGEQLEVWMLQVLELKLVDSMKELEAKVAKKEDEEEEGK